MAHYVYVAAQDDNKVGIFTMDADSGALTHQADARNARRPITAGHQPRQRDAVREPP